MKLTRLFFFIILVGLQVFLVTPPVAAKSDWISVRTKNFTLIGDAGEKDIRRVAAQLEQFRESIKTLFPKVNLDKPIPTVVYVFSSHASFHQFKPRVDGKIKENVAGYFLEGRENMIIALTEEARGGNPYEVIFHEYQHYILDNNFDDPPLWLNEGLAELYSQFKVDDQGLNIRLGKPIDRHIYTLRANEMLPLEKLFSVNHRSKEYNERGKAGIFYAQSWALVHYLMLGNQMKRATEFSNFLAMQGNGLPMEENFRKAFGVGYAEMETELRKYVGRFQFPVIDLTLKGKLEVEKDMQSFPLSEAETEYELGRLQFQMRDLDGAEKRLRKSIALDAKQAQARAWLGLLLTSQAKYDEAESQLAESVKIDANYYSAHIFQGDLFARRNKTEEAVAAYRRAVEINPKMPRTQLSLAAYLSFIERDDEAFTIYNRALRLAPREPRPFYSSSIVALRIRRGLVATLQAQSYLRMQGWDESSSPYAALVAYFGFRVEKRAPEANKILNISLERLDKTVWAYSIFRYLKREISAEELLKLAIDSDKQTEARTYIGMDLAFDGKTDDAKPYFQWVLANGNRNYIEYGFSRAELDRIEKSSAKIN